MGEVHHPGYVREVHHPGYVRERCTTLGRREGGRLPVYMPRRVWWPYYPRCICPGIHPWVYLRSYPLIMNEQAVYTPLCGAV